MVIDPIINRRSVRAYKKDTVEDKHIEEIIKAAQFAPSAKNNKAVEFIVIKDQKTKNKLYEILSSVAAQDFIKEAPVLIMPVSDTTKSRWSHLDIAVATENMMLQATELGLGTVWKHVYPELVEPIKQLLNIPKKYTITNIVPVGYPKDKISSHTDQDFDSNKIHIEKWGI